MLLAAAIPTEILFINAKSAASPVLIASKLAKSLANKRSSFSVLMRESAIKTWVVPVAWLLATLALASRLDLLSAKTCKPLTVRSARPTSALTWSSTVLSCTPTKFETTCPCTPPSGASKLAALTCTRPTGAPSSPVNDNRAAP